MGKALKTGLRLLILTGLVLAALFLWYVIQPWLAWGLPIAAAAILGVVALIGAILYLISRGESNSYNEAQLMLQKYAMINAANHPRADSGAARVAYATTGPVLEPDPIDWNVRKTQDGKAYAVVPLLNGNPVWTAALPERFTPDYTGQMAAWDLALQLRSQPELTAGEGN